MDLFCPECQQPLAPDTGVSGAAWHCRNGHGHTVGMGPLRDLLDHGIATNLWRQSASAPASDRCCPSCARQMAFVHAPGESGAVAIDLCRRCHMAWLDEGEWDQLPQRPRGSRSEMPEEAVEVMARAGARSVAEQAPQNHAMPDTFALEWVTGLYRDDGHRGRRLLVTPVTGVIAALVIVAILALHAGAFDAELGVVGTVFHTLWMLLDMWVAVWYLFTFGSEVEARIGSTRTIAMLATAAAAGTLANAVITPSLDAVVIGAMASLASLAAFFVLAFPKVPFQMLVVFIPIVRWIRLTARTAGLIYAGYVAIVALPSLLVGQPSTAAAFLASGAIGSLWWLAWRDQLRAASRVARVAAESVVVRS